MTTIEYLSLSKPQRILYKIANFFIMIPKGILSFFKKLPKKCRAIVKKLVNPFKNLYTYFARGDYKTRLSFLLMGFGQVTRHQYIRGIFNFIFEIVAILFVVLIGIPNWIKLPSFGYTGQTQYIDTNSPTFTYIYKDDSFNILLYSILAIIVLLLLVYLWYSQIKEAYRLQEENNIGHIITDKTTINDFTGKNYHKVLLGIPTFGLVMFTIIPLIFMILIGFSNYSSAHNSPKELFDWIGLNNFSRLFGITGSGGNQFASVFLQILIWTLVWAFFATFTNYFFGMIVAIMINKKGIKLKKMWRTILIMTIAVPQFVSLLLMSKMFDQDLGVVNKLLMQWGWISSPIPWWKDGLIAKVLIICINMWIGIPYTMLISTGLLLNIPEDLYESAKIDGANAYKMYMRITLPYMLFVTGPYLISNFTGNINNFNVIYLLTQGGPVFTTVNGQMIAVDVFGAGQTDLLITWLYKIAMGEVNKDYGVASVIGIVVFVVVAFISLIFYKRTNSVKNEEDFQ
ncbi:MAG: sugar ABC transporter permease [Candidatus Onthovivens sp.]|nr:sugar ABC transporter permease [Candidatus Onthovivens sp.]